MARMASLEKRGNGYRIIFRLHGLKYTAALKTRSERAAQAALVRLEDNLYRLQIGTLHPPEDADLVSFLLADGRTIRKPPVNAARGPATRVAAVNRDAITLSALFTEYFSKLPEGNLEPTTIDSMKRHQRQLEQHFGRSYLLQAVTTSALQEYIEKRSHDEGRHGRKVTATTIKKPIVTLRTVWNWGRQHGLIERLFPSKGLKYPKGREKPPFMSFAEVVRRSANCPAAEAADLWDCAFLTLEDVAHLLDEVKRRARYPFVYPLFVFAAHTGARRSEMIRSQLSDLDFEGNLVTIRERKKSHEKRTTRRVPMSPLLRATLLEWVANHPGGDHTFCQHIKAAKSRKERNGPLSLTPDEAHDHFRFTLAGTKWEKLRGWHVFRHSFCSNCAAVGIDQRIIDEWAGHLSGDMVRRYRHLLPGHEQAAIRTVFG
jgi:integrase